MTRMLTGMMVAAVALACAGAPVRADQPSLKTVPKVELSRYLGTWYEIARYPTRFQKNCYAATATYRARDDGDIEVLNRCHKDSPTGEVKESRGKAWVVDRESNAKLKVSFFWPFRGDYWIIDLGPNYEYAVVGHPERKYLWILSRTPQLDPPVYEGILERLRAQAYDTTKLIPSR